MNRDNQTGLLWIGSVLHDLLQPVLLILFEFSLCNLYLLHFVGCDLAGLLVVRVHLLALLLDLLCQLLVDAKLAIGLFLGLVSLRHEHLPSANVVHRLVLMGQQVALHERRIPHGDLATSSLQRTLPSDVSK